MISIQARSYTLLPKREVSHLLGRHRQRTPYRVVLEKLGRVLVLGCACERTATTSGSADLGLSAKSSRVPSQTSLAGWFYGEKVSINRRFTSSRRLRTPTFSNMCER